MKSCPSCGEKLREIALYCGGCGAEANFSSLDSPDSFFVSKSSPFPSPAPAANCSEGGKPYEPKYKTRLTTIFSESQPPSDPAVSAWRDRIRSGWQALRLKQGLTQWSGLRWEVRLSIAAIVPATLCLWVLLAVIGDELFTPGGLACGLLLTPLLAIAAFCVARPEPSAVWCERLGEWSGSKRRRAESKQSFFARWFFRPAWAALHGATRLTAGIRDPHLRTGVTIALQLFVVYLALSVVLLVASVIVGVILLAFALVMLWLVMKVVSWFSSEGGTTVPRRQSSWSPGKLFASGRSEVQTDFFGNEYVQHYDDHRNKTGHSEESTDFFGNQYVQHFDENQNKEGWSEEQTGFFGNHYIQHRSNENEKVGHSEKQVGFLGNEYVQHYDQRGDPTGRSEERSDLLGNKYVKHEPE
jgi:hypothetical protein